MIENDDGGPTKGPIARRVQAQHPILSICGEVAILQLLGIVPPK